MQSSKTIISMLAIMYGVFLSTASAQAQTTYYGTSIVSAADNATRAVSRAQGHHADGGTPFCPLPSCIIDFDSGCPDEVEICGAGFVGGVTCVFDGLPFCYDSGLFSYAIDPGFPLTITFSGDLVDLEVYFANIAGSSGEMRFFDAQGEEVGTPLETNGDCQLFMPPTQVQVFKEAVRSIDVVATGGGRVYIDTFMVNPQSTPVDGCCQEDNENGLYDMNCDGFISIIGDVPPFVDCVYFGDCCCGEECECDCVCAGDCNCDGFLSIIGDVPCFVDCVYFNDCVQCLAANGGDGFTIGGAVYDDPVEPLFNGVEGTAVLIIDADGDVIASTTTGPTGLWKIENLPEGTYVVSYESEDKGAPNRQDSIKIVVSEENKAANQSMSRLRARRVPQLSGPERISRQRAVE